MPDSLRLALYRYLRVLGPTGCWEWAKCRIRRGYGVFRRVGSDPYVHRLSYELHIGPIPAGQCVLHRCDNPPCFNPDHLFLGTIQDNAADMVAKGRQQHGERSGKAKLTEEKIAVIRAIGDSRTQQQIADSFGITQAHVGRILRGERWRHLPIERRA